MDDEKDNVESCGCEAEDKDVEGMLDEIFGEQVKPPQGDYDGCGCGCEVDDEVVEDMLDEVFGEDEEDQPPDQPDEPVDDDPEPPPNSILEDVKKWIGIVREYKVFDSDILMDINSAFFTLFQLGVGPRDGFVIEDSMSIWTDFSENQILISAVKQYVMLKVRNTFDPPTSSYVLNANQSKIDELEWRLRELCSGYFDFDEEELPDDPIPEEPPDEPPPPEDPSEDSCPCDCETATDEEAEEMLDKIFN